MRWRCNAIQQIEAGQSRPPRRQFSSGIVDGAAGVLIGTKEMGEHLGLKARARILGARVCRLQSLRSCSPVLNS